MLLEKVASTPLGALVKIDTAEFLHRAFSVVGKRSMNRHIMGEDYPWVDLHIKEDLHDAQYRLRFLSSHEHIESVVILSLYNSFPWSEEFTTLMRDSLFRCGDGQIFTRTHTLPYDAYGTLENAREKEMTAITYWDWYRQIDESGVIGNEFCYVECDNKTKMYDIWVGPEISPLAVSLV